MKAIRVCNIIYIYIFTPFHVAFKVFFEANKQDASSMLAD